MQWYCLPANCKPSPEARCRVYSPYHQQKTCEKVSKPLCYSVRNTACRFTTTVDTSEMQTMGQVEN